MSDVKQYEVAGATYNFAQAPAVKQKSLMSIIGANVMMKAFTSEQTEVDIPFLKGVLLAMPEDKFDKIASLVLCRVIKNGESKAVDIADFQGGMNAYLTLIAYAVKVNLQDFFTWLDDERKQTQEQAVTNQKAQ